MSETKNTFLLLQAGDLFSTWIIYHLKNKVKNCSIIDMGRALDVLALDENLAFAEEDQKLGNLIFSDFKKQDWIKFKKQ